MLRLSETEEPVATVAALAVTSAAYAGPPHCDSTEKLCDNSCIPKHMVCRKSAQHPQCDLLRSKPCENTCIPKAGDCHKG